MKIFSMKPGHDGSVALVDTDSTRLLWSYEAEKDSFPRYESFNPHNLVEAASMLGEMPDVFAVSGWAKGGLAKNAGIGGGYYGHGSDNPQVREARLFGAHVTHFTSSHLRAHIMSSYAMSPFEQGRPAYALVWEGAMGDFYRIDEQLEISHAGTVMMTPGNKYAFLYALADPTFRLPKGRLRYEDPGKLMALCAFGQSGAMTEEEQKTTSFLLDRESILMSLDKEDMRWSRYYNIGLQHPEFTRLAKRFSDEIFKRFHDFARDKLERGLPLLISGGCGLNCDWNTAWRESGLFDGVFVPPCTNDTGAAIGTAVDAMWTLTGKAKLQWNVYCGQDFVDDEPEMPGAKSMPLDLADVARRLAAGRVVAWADGPCEIGPRALGHRSLLAAPFGDAMRERLNAIKQREGFRPIAPICLEEDVSEHFEWQGASPFMLYFQKVRNRDLRAITHVDGTARVQTVNRAQNPLVHQLLNEFKAITGAGVLCNTSLNFNGRGFINRTSDLHAYCVQHAVDDFVCAGRLHEIQR